METSLKSNKIVPMVNAILGISFCFLMSTPVYAAKNNEDPIAKSERTPGKRNQNKVNQMLNNESVKIYPDMLKRTMHVLAKDNETEEIVFIVFDIKGNLVLNYKMKTGSHEKITGLDRGQYTYHVFCENSETATGTFIIK